MESKTLYAGWLDWFDGDGFIYSLDYDRCKAELKKCYDTSEGFDNTTSDFEEIFEEGVLAGIVEYELV